MTNDTNQPDDAGTLPIVIYTTMFCPFCHRAKHLLNKKAVRYKEIDVTLRPVERLAMREKASGRNTVPQIFIGQIHVGGCDDLFALERDGRLDGLLKGAL
ncbi:MAG: glutaredoxin [Alphaproteobacteria bacterium BRH_c36]|nr:MAG: glutaredoxin [Alphaproteobacteria bacterium BRH_c36]